MEITEAKQTYRLQERMRLVQEQRESGQTIRVWCERNKIKESNYYYWLREIRKAALQSHADKKPEEEQAFVRIELSGSGNSGVENAALLAIRMQYKGAMLDIPPGTRGEDLAMVLKALGKE